MPLTALPHVPRTPAADPLIANTSDTLGPRTTHRLEEMRSEFGMGAISRRNATERLFHFTEGTALGLQFESRAYASHDPYVVNTPVRHAVAEQLRHQFGGRTIAFVESAGLIDLGGGLQSVLPVEAFPYGGATLTCGFSAGGLLHYRSSGPQVLGMGERARAPQKPHFVLPLNAERAAQLMPGCEVELSGQGKLTQNVGLAARVGEALTPTGISGGVAAVVSVNDALQGEFSFNVMALDKPGLVRVTLRKMNEAAAGILSRIQGGILFATGSIVPEPIGGILRYYTDKLGAPNFESYVTLHTTLSAALYGHMARHDFTIAAFDLDLRTHEGRRAYDHLIFLNTLEAEALADAGSPSVRYVHLEESDCDFKYGMDVRLANLKLLAFEALESERHGCLTPASGQHLIYRHSLYRQSFNSFFSGRSTVSWEAVSIKAKDRDRAEPFLRVFFEHKEYNFEKSRIDWLLRLAAGFGVSRSEMTGHDHELFDKVQEHLCKLAEVTTTADVYFTSNGIDNINNADAQMATLAYLQASNDLFKQYEGIGEVFLEDDVKAKKAEALIAEYRARTDLTQLFTSERLKLVPQLRKEYEALTKRKLDEDAKLLKDAEAFGAVVAELKDSQNSDQVASLMTSLGRRKGFDFAQSLLALALLAGPEETLLHHLGVEGGGYAIRNESEGKLRNPRDLLAAELGRLAQN